MHTAKKISIKLRKIFRILGPGLITGASDDDPSGIATYSQAGASLGFGLLWTALLTFPLMASIQEMCARIGIVTETGLTTTLRKYYSKNLLYLMLLFSFPAITLNIGADIQGMSAVAKLFFPKIPNFIFSILITISLAFIIVKFSYKKIARILKWLCITLLLYIIVPFSVKVNWFDVLKSTVIPTIHFDKAFFEIFVAILGTTISPYLFFWQATMEAEDISHKKNIIINKKIIHRMEADIDFGMFFSNLIMFFIILSTGSVLFTAGITQIETVEQAAKALEPLTGKLTYIFFSAGVIGTGFLAIPILSGSLSYILAETFGWQKGLDKKFIEAKGFYVTILVSLIIGMSLDFLGVSPIKMLIYTAILYGLTAPVLIAVILHICNNKKIMGNHTNKKWSNILGGITLILMTICAIALIYFQFV